MIGKIRKTGNKYKCKSLDEQIYTNWKKGFDVNGVYEEIRDLTFLELLNHISTDSKKVLYLLGNDDIPYVVDAKNFKLWE